MESANSTVPNAKTVAPVRKKTVKIVFKFLIGLALIPVLLTAYFYIGGIEWGDWTIPNEAELRLEKRDVPDEDNAYIALMSLTNLYHVADNDQVNEKSGDDSAKVVSDKDFVKYYGNLLNSEGWEDWAAVRSDPASPKRAEKILAENAKFFDAFSAALSFKYFVDTDARLEDAKRVKKDKPPWVPYEPRYIPFIIDFEQLVSLRAQVALEKGDVQSAVSAIGEIHALGQLVMADNESLVAYLVGDLIERISFRKMCDVVAMGKATGEVVERFSKMVAVSEANAPKVWERGIKAVIAMQFETVEWVCNHPTHVFGMFHFDDVVDEHGDVLPPTLLSRILFSWPGFTKFAFHRREMLYRQAMLGRALLAGDDDLMEMIWLEIQSVPFSPNFVGKLVNSKLCPTFGSYSRIYSLDRIRPRLVIAAEKWRRAHGGENPLTLEALVPDYLAAVPTDPWSKSGEPIKYDASTGVAWSVGKKGTYDYRKVAKDRADGSERSVDGDTQTYAFRLDGKPINNEGTPECDVEPEVQPKEKLRKEENPPADVRRRHWLVPVASCRTAMSGRCDSRAFVSGMDRGLAEGEVISPSVGKCGYRVLSISDNCVWFEAFYDDEPPEDKLPRGPWPDFSRIDTIPPVPPPGRLMLGKRHFWPGDAIKLQNSGWYLKVDDFLEGRGAVFRLLDSSMRPVRELLCVIVREER